MLQRAEETIVRQRSDQGSGSLQRSFYRGTGFCRVTGSWHFVISLIFLAIFHRSQTFQKGFRLQCGSRVCMVSSFTFSCPANVWRFNFDSSASTSTSENLIWKVTRTGGQSQWHRWVTILWSLVWADVLTPCWQLCMFDSPWQQQRWCPSMVTIPPSLTSIVTTTMVATTTTAFNVDSEHPTMTTVDDHLTTATMDANHPTTNIDSNYLTRIYRWLCVIHDAWSGCSWPLSTNAMDNIMYYLTQYTSFAMHWLCKMKLGTKQ